MKAFVYSHVGSFHRTNLSADIKGHDILLKAFAGVCRCAPDALLFCAGEGRLLGECRELAKSLGITDRVKFCGVLPDSSMLFKAADVFCLPSRYEGLPVALIEAASWGVPVVASDIEEIRSVIPGEYSVLVPAGSVSGFTAVLEEARRRIEELRIRAGAYAALIRERHSMRYCAEQYEKLYEDILPVPC